MLSREYQGRNAAYTLAQPSDSARALITSIGRPRGVRSFWTAAPSNPSPFGLFSNSATYERPGAAYIALMRILGTPNFTRALQHLQRRYGGSHITEPQLEAGFRQWLPDTSAACEDRLSQFFTQWFDTAYPSGGDANKPAITGPGLAGPGFYKSGGGCPA